jgi:hypothetical protein
MTNPRYHIRNNFAANRSIERDSSMATGSMQRGKCAAKIVAKIGYRISVFFVRLLAAHGRRTGCPQGDFFFKLFGG